MRQFLRSALCCQLKNSKIPHFLYFGRFLNYFPKNSTLLLLFPHPKPRTSTWESGQEQVVADQQAWDFYTVKE